MSPAYPSAAVALAETAHEPDGYRYHLLRAATARFQRNIPALSEQELREAEEQAQRSFALEERVLQSPEAGSVLIPDTQVQRAYGEVRQRYTSDAEFEEDLNRNGLDSLQLRQALRRELIFDAVMQRIGASHAPITETDERLFFELHRDRFTPPETRTARHILITINDDYPENSRSASRARIEAIAGRLNEVADDPAALAQRFARHARKASECPTAMEGGQLGALGRGQLYPALDAALFTLKAGAVSGIVESELGFHLILCETIHAAKSPPFAKVRERIRQALEQRRRKDAQRQWLASLPA